MNDDTLCNVLSSKTWTKIYDYFFTCKSATSMLHILSNPALITIYVRAHVIYCHLRKGQYGYLCDSVKYDSIKALVVLKSETAVAL